MIDAEARAARPHPLSYLSADEMARASTVARHSCGLPRRQLRFISVELVEPTKSAYLTWRDAGGPAPPRQAMAVVLDLERRRSLEITVSLDPDAHVRTKVLPAETQPATPPEECVAAADAVRHDEAYQAALRARGIHDPNAVHVEAWAVGDFEPTDRRVVRALSWVRDPHDPNNPYARPLYGLVAVVDLYDMRVLRVDDHAPGHPPPTERFPYHTGGRDGFRSDLLPIEITQPRGPSFSLEGDLLRWQNWDIRVGLHQREGLVLHDIGYRDGDRRRPICHRASIAELVVPYGDPNPTVHFKNVFDVGEYGMGPLTNTLTLGCDCLGEIRYLDGVVNDLAGDPVTIRNAVCIHEEDDNILWKHTTAEGRVDRARARRLVISSIATVGNYEYGYFWYFHLDGSWEFEAKLTGIVHTAGTLTDDGSPFSLPLGEGVVTSVHQHFFCARLDLDVDGCANSAFQSESEAAPWGPQNPDGTAFHTHHRYFESEQSAVADVSIGGGRRFRVENPSQHNRLGRPVSYELVPGENARPLQQPGSTVRRRARFLDHHVWITRYDPDERYPAGDYPNQSTVADGLSQWITDDANLINEDIVLWYVFGAHHVPRLEDWPVMPVVKCGFELRPIGFFEQNPALDVPPPVPGGHCCASPVP